jgi:hypothetical protein
VQQQFAEKSAAYRDRPHMLNQLKSAITVLISNFSKAYLQKGFANLINPLPYTAGLARSVNTQPVVRRSEPLMSCF